MNAPIILAIDDDAERYGHLRDLLGSRARLVVASCPACVAEHLPGAAAVLLDYDLDLMPCPGCGADTGSARTRGGLLIKPNDHGKGTRHAADIVVPTIVVSAAGKVADDMAIDMRRAGSHVARLSVVSVDPEIRWIGRLWAWGVL